MIRRQISKFSSSWTALCNDILLHREVSASTQYLKSRQVSLPARSVEVSAVFRSEKILSQISHGKMFRGASAAMLCVSFVWVCHSQILVGRINVGDFHR